MQKILINLDRPPMRNPSFETLPFNQIENQQFYYCFIFLSWRSDAVKERPKLKLEPRSSLQVRVCRFRFEVGLSSSVWPHLLTVQPLVLNI
jgi:hypothetical protein